MQKTICTHPCCSILWHCEHFIFNSLNECLIEFPKLPMETHMQVNFVAFPVTAGRRLKACLLHICSSRTEVWRPLQSIWLQWFSWRSQDGVRQRSVFVFALQIDFCQLTTRRLTFCVCITDTHTHTHGCQINRRLAHLWGISIRETADPALTCPSHAGCVDSYSRPQGIKTILVLPPP